MKIKEHLYSQGKAALVYPFDGLHSSITAEACQSFGQTELTYTVNWPSIGSVPTDKARQFAAAINAACDWLEEKKREVENAG